MPSVEVEPHVTESLSDGFLRWMEVDGHCFCAVGAARRALLARSSRRLESGFSRGGSARASTLSRLDELTFLEGGPRLLAGRRTGCRPWLCRVAGCRHDELGSASLS